MILEFFQTTFILLKKLKHFSSNNILIMEDWCINNCHHCIITLLYFDKFKLYCCCPFLLCMSNEYKENLNKKLMNIPENNI